MSLTNKVLQFDQDSDKVHAWVHGPAIGAGSTITTDSGIVVTPAKLIADNEAEIQAIINVTNAWANGPATGTGSTVTLGGAAIASPAKVIADQNAVINAGASSVLALATAQAGISTTQASIATTQAGLATTNCVQSGDWLITRYGNGLMTMDCNTNISTNTLIMTGATLSYSATLTMPDSFKDGNYTAVANICFNGVAAFLLIDNPMIAVRPNAANIININAKRATSVGVDGYFYSIRCVGLWK